MYKQRMYGFVPYNISDIQKGIQFGHAAFEYSLLYSYTDEYKQWLEYDKTFIILNGGTTNKNISSEFYGSLNKISDTLSENGIKHACFYEPDLGEQLTGITLLVDERVWDRIEYPNYADWLVDFSNQVGDDMYKLPNLSFRSLYLAKIGNKENLFLKEFLQKYKLA